MIKSFFTRILAVLFFLSPGALSFAINSPKLQTLLQQLERPTINQVYEVIEGNFNNLPFYDANALVNTYETLLPGLIASLERGFPGATWVGMGRDSALLVNALDAFYQARGQKGRALHLWASGDTIGSASPQQLVKALQQLGMDLPNAEHSPPFILFDATHFNGSSQSNLVLRAIYGEAHRLGIPLQPLLHRVNFVNTHSVMYPHNRVHDQFDMKAFLNHVQVSPERGPHDIMSFDTAALMYGHEWSDSYGQFRQDAAGKVYALPIAGHSEGLKSAVLGDMAGIMKLVTSEGFYKRVQANAKKLQGYDFESVLKLRDGNYQAPQPPPHKTFEEKLSELKLETLPEERTYSKANNLKLTANGHKVFDFILSNGSLLTNEDQLKLMLEFMATAEQNEQIGERDFQRILGFIMSEVTLAPSHLEVLRNHQNDSHHLYKKIWERVTDVDSDKTDIYKGNAAAIQQSLYSTCTLSLHAQGQ